ncbi:MAG: hypothetical protein LAT65_13080 [Saccharospirillum sp.]|nr:hypothetical protein [Saccharospirillum sp.]
MNTHYVKPAFLSILTAAAVLLSGCNSSSSSTDPSDTDNGNGTTPDADVRSWTLIDADKTPTSSLYSIFQLDKNTLWAVGQGTPSEFGGIGALILKSTDGGGTWTQYVNDYWNRLTGVHFVDENNGWIVGGLSSGNPPMILRTQNAGATWSEQSHPISDEGTFFDIEFVSATHGWIAGGHNALTVEESDRFILHTTDGGNTWNKVAFDFGNGLPFLSVSFVDTMNGWAVGRDTEDETNDSYYYTTDGGVNWQTGKTGVYEQIGPYADRFDLVQFVDNNHGYLAGVSRVMRTTDGGLTWSLAFQDGGMNIYDMAFVDAQRGWLVGNGIGSDNAVAKIFYTENGGITWYEESVTDLPTGFNENTALRGVHALNADNVIAVGNRVTILARESD